MKPHQINLINAVILIAFSAWGYLGSSDPSFTALIPAVFGVLFLVMNPALKKENKIAAHLIVLLTLFIIVALYMPLKGSIGRGDTMGIVRVVVMMVSSLVAMIVYINSFIRARRAKN